MSSLKVAWKRKGKKIFYLPPSFEYSWWWHVSLTKAENTNESVKTDSFNENTAWVFAPLVCWLFQEKPGICYHMRINLQI